MNYILSITGAQMAKAAAFKFGEFLVDINSVHTSVAFSSYTKEP